MKFHLYTKDNCPYCTRAKLLLNAKNLEYTETHIGKDITREEFVDLFPGVMTAPFVVLELEQEMEHIGGFVDLMNYLEKLND